MNCANHPDRERVAFCQHCGKPLCAECVRNVGSSIFCEPCLIARVAATGQPGGGGYAGAGYGSAGGPAASGYAAAYLPRVPGAPNPAVAALLGFIPGVGAMYNGQYAKGIVHLVVFAVLVSLANESEIFGLFVAGWIAYMVIEAHHTARARRDGTPLPNPFGLNDLSERLGFGKAWPSAAPFGTAQQPGAHQPGAIPDPNAANPGGPGAGVPPGSPYTPPYTYSYVPPVSHWGAPKDYGYGFRPAPPNPPVPPVPPLPPFPDANVPYHHRFPAGAIWLILIGLFFLLGDTGIFHIFHTRLFGPFLVIGVGVWLFVRRMTGTGHGLENDGSDFYRWRLSRAIAGSIWVILLGAIWLVDDLHIFSFRESWPILLIAGGVLLLFKRSLHGGYGPYAPGVYPVSPEAPVGPAPVTTTEIVPSGPKHPGDSQEGR